MKNRVLFLTVVLGALWLGGCVTAPPPHAPPPAPPPVVPPPNTNVYAYPVHGQTPEQQDRDRYECSVWATQQSGFSPSAPGVQAQPRVVSSPSRPPGTGTAIGAVTGAILGAAISNPWQSATGALAGAMVGGAIGTAADAADAQQTRTVYVADQRQIAQQQSQAGNYRRAMGACLDARGYSVK